MPLKVGLLLNRPRFFPLFSLSPSAKSLRNKDDNNEKSFWCAALMFAWWMSKVEQWGWKPNKRVCLCFQDPHSALLSQYVFEIENWLWKLKIHQFEVRNSMTQVTLMTYIGTFVCMLNWFQLVYWLFRLSNMQHALYNHFLPRPARKGSNHSIKRNSSKQTTRYCQLSAFFLTLI